MSARVLCSVAALTAVSLVSVAPPLGAYLKNGVQINGRTEALRWAQFPVRYMISNVGVDGVTPLQFQTAVTRAFNTWDAVATTETSSTFVGFTQLLPVREDGATVLGYVSRPDQDRVLAATSFTVEQTAGRLVESDIFFNSIFLWSTSDAGTTGRFDVESIAVHEIGHLLGLAHSALGETEVMPGGRRVIAAEAVMFPIAFTRGNIADRSLKADDIAGISDIYRTNDFSRETGSISGRVTKSGRGVQGAHVVAFNPRTGTLIGGFSLNTAGDFVIAGLEPGPQILRAEPLDDGDLTSFFSEGFEVDVDFRVKFYERVVTVPRGGGTGDVEIKVIAK
jgi:hypothetical protein